MSARRTTSLTAATTLGLALLAPALVSGPATAAGETCRGEAATIVGTGPRVTGTDGRDIIVSGASTVVDALGGDDLICVTGPTTTKQLEITAGYGDDVVDTSTLDGAYSLNVTLGEGADTLFGGAAAETVTTGFLEFPAGVDSDTDTVSTGAGDDRVFVGSYPTYPNPSETGLDVVDLGPGDDVAEWGRGFGTAPGVVLTGGPGDDRLSFGLNGQRTTAAIDMAAGTVQVTSYGVTELGRFTSFESAEIAADVYGQAFPLVDAIDFRGTSGDDELVVHHDRSGSSRMSIETGAGDDSVRFHGVRLRPGSRIDLGRGDDELVAAQDRGRLDLDLGRRVLRTRAAWLGSPVSATTRVLGVENALLMAPEAKLVGDRNDNDLFFNGCRGTLRGGAGADLLSRLGGDPWWDEFTYDCDALDLESNSTMSGGPGNDRLRGGTGDDRLRGEGGNDRLEGRGGDDVLLGGRGRDTADGGKGRDRCVAETSKRCER